MPYKEPSEEAKWKKGQSGNPKGRPKKIPELEKLLNEVLGDENDQTSDMYLIIRNLVKQAKKSNPAAIRAAEVLLNRAYGQAKEKIEVDATEPIVFKFTQEKDKS